MRTDWKFNFEPVIFGWRRDGKHHWYGDQKQKACFDFASIRNSTTEGWNHRKGGTIHQVNLYR